MFRGFAIAAAVLLGTVTLFSDVCNGQDPKKGAVKEFAQSFRGQAKEGLAFSLFGPKAANFVRFEPEGLRITLPNGHPKNGPYVGVNADIAVEGDFEITVRYEILKEPGQADGFHPATKLVLMGVVDTPEWSPVVLGRIIGANGETMYSMWRTLAINDGEENPTKGKQLAMQAKSGRLRMIRTGMMISYHAAEGDAADFQFLHEFPFTDRNLKQVRVLGAVGGVNSFLDARVTDLRIRMGPELHELAGVAPIPAVPGAPKDTSKAWLAAVLAFALALTSILAAVIGVLYYMRRATAPRMAR